MILVLQDRRNKKRDRKNFEILEMYGDPASTDWTRTYMSMDKWEAIFKVGRFFDFQDNALYVAC